MGQSASVKVHRSTGFDPSCLTLYKAPFCRYRLGRDGDGGYIVFDLPCTYDLLLSGGVSDDISFEVAFCSLHPQVPCVAFDGTVEGLPEKHPNITFFKKNIGKANTDSLTNWHEYLNKFQNIFIKMDIEGHEFPWLSTLTTNQLQNVAQIVMEFHNPNSAFHQEQFDKLNQTHYLVHLHGNNCSQDLTIHNGVVVPNVFEVTYVNKRFFQTTPSLNTVKLPTELDHTNSPGAPELTIDYPPFVHLKQ